MNPHYYSNSMYPYIIQSLQVVLGPRRSEEDTARELSYYLMGMAPGERMLVERLDSCSTGSMFMINTKIPQGVTKQSWKWPQP